MKLLQFIFAGSLIILLIGACSQKLPVQTLNLRDYNRELYSATSELDYSDMYTMGKYDPYNLFDRDNNTCWAEGKEDAGIGESVYWRIKADIPHITMVNGFAGSETLFQKNNRVKELSLSVYVGANLPGHVTEICISYDCIKFPKSKKLILKDTREPQKITFPFDWADLKKFRQKAMQVLGPQLKGEYILQMIIESVYKGTEYNDTCLSDIWVDSAIDTIKNIYVNKWDNAVLMDTINETEIVLVKDEASVFQILEVSKNKEWVIVIRMPAEAEGSRVETQYYLYNNMLRKEVDKSLLSENADVLYGFDEQGALIYLKFLDGKTMNDDSIELQSVYDRMVQQDKP